MATDSKGMDAPETHEPHPPSRETADDRPLVLCANDDGIFSRGLGAVVESLSAFARVIVVAPETEQSAMSHSLTLHRPLRLRRVAEDRFALDGTPADCVYLALHLGEVASDGGGEGRAKRGETAASSAVERRPSRPRHLSQASRILPRKPDLVVSGINKGINVGQDVFYSGTVAAAREGALRGIPAIAASCEVPIEAGGPAFDPSTAAALVARVARAVLALPPPLAGTDTTALLLNLNVPAGPVRGLVHTRLGTRLWTESVEARTDPRGRAYYWLGGRGVRHHLVPGSDTEAFDAGLASLTALNLDLARHDDVARSAIANIVSQVGV